MIFDFIIIPVNNTFINVAFYLRYKLEEINYFSQIIIDKNYHDSFSSRVNICREKKYNIITINEDYNEAQTINVIFQHTDFKVETMPLRDFLILVSDYIDDNDNDNENFGLNCIIA
jgi:hypothetical protein